MSDVLIGSIVSGLIALSGVIYVQRVTRALRRETDLDSRSDTRQQIEAKAYERAEASNERSRKEAERYAERLETRLVAVEKRAEDAETEAQKCTRALEEERRDRRATEDRQAEDVTRKLEAERRARRLAENREAEHASEVRRLWVIVTGLREAIRLAGIDVPAHLLTGGIGVLEDEAPSNEWSEHSADQDEQ